LLKEYRVIANDLPGTTRDAVKIHWIHRGRRLVLVDTAGVRPKSGKQKELLERQVEEEVEQTVNYSHVVIVIIDAMEAFTRQDLMVINKALKEGRGIVVAANKWDLVKDEYRRRAVKWMSKQIEKGFGDAKGVPIAFISAKTGLRTEKVMDEVLRVYEKWNTRISTSLLNKWQM
jgi:GTP-binding protein